MARITICVKLLCELPRERVNPDRDFVDLGQPLPRALEHLESGGLSDADLERELSIYVAGAQVVGQLVREASLDRVAPARIRHARQTNSELSSA